MKSILKYPNDQLRNSSRKVDFSKDNVKELSLELKKVVRNSNTDDLQLGLSAPQLGVNLRMFVFLNLEVIEYITVINPEILYQSDELTTFEESCLSGNAGFLNISRPSVCEISYLDEDGSTMFLKAEGLMSHVIQHEIDHLDGVMYFDRSDYHINSRNT